MRVFADGFYVMQAIAMKADADDLLGNIDAALTGYTSMISKVKNQYTEQALYRASDILLKKQNYVQALEETFIELE